MSGHEGVPKHETGLWEKGGMPFHRMSSEEARAFVQEIGWKLRVPQHMMEKFFPAASKELSASGGYRDTANPVQEVPWGILRVYCSPNSSFIRTAEQEATKSGYHLGMPEHALGLLQANLVGDEPVYALGRPYQLDYEYVLVVDPRMKEVRDHMVSGGTSSMNLLVTR